MSEAHMYPVPPEFAAKAHVDAAKYEAMYAASVSDPDGFWREHGKRLRWMRHYTKVKNVNWDISKTNDPNDLQVKWYEDGTLNVSANCIDRHLPHKADTTAIVFEGDDPSVSRRISYAELYSEVCRFANVLKGQGVKKGDRVTIYMPMIPEAAYAMLACARIGAVHSVVFGGFSPDSLAGRLEDCASTCVVTADEGVRGGKPIPLKANVDEAIDRLGDRSPVKSVIVIKRTGGNITLKPGRDEYYSVLAKDENDDCEPEEMSAEDPLFILYTSGSTGKPKGVLHTTGGYLVWASMTHEIVFDYKPTATSTGARPMWAGSPGTAISSTARSPMARPR
jgi:acetyl-CoA synthetase